MLNQVLKAAALGRTAASFNRHSSRRCLHSAIKAQKTGKKHPTNSRPSIQPKPRRIGSSSVARFPHLDGIATTLARHRLGDTERALVQQRKDSSAGTAVHTALREVWLQAEKAQEVFVFTSNLAAISAVVELVDPGRCLLVSDQLGEDVRQLLQQAATARGVCLRFVPTWNLDSVEEAFRPGSTLKKDSAAAAAAAATTFDSGCCDETKQDLAVPQAVFLQTPSDPLMHVSDVRTIAQIAHSHGALLLVDNSVMSPVLMNPLRLGADVVVHSSASYLGSGSGGLATASLGGTQAGIVAVSSRGSDTSPSGHSLTTHFANAHKVPGAAVTSSLEALLMLQEMRTLAVRVNAAQQNAQHLGRFLKSHPHVSKVHYLDAFLGAGSNHQRLQFSQANGGGSVLSFETGSEQLSRDILANSRLFRSQSGTTLWSLSSCIDLPATHGKPEDEGTTNESMIPLDLIRLTVGVEDINDLLADLSHAIAAAVSVNDPDHLDEDGVPRAKTLSQPLGVSLPVKDEHAVGVSMPRWRDVVAYEEGCETTLGLLAGGYPRFVFLKPVQRLFAAAEDLFCEAGETAMAVPSARVALRLQAFLARSGVDQSRIQVRDFFALGVFAVTMPLDAAPIAKAFWQHSGEIVSSRLAAAVLDIVDRTCYENASSSSSSPSTAQSVDPKAPSVVGDDLLLLNDDDVLDGGMSGQLDRSATEALTDRVASVAGVHRSSVFLYPTGMAAVTAAHRLLKLASQWENEPLPTVVWGFPYLDTLKVSQLAGPCHFFGRGDEADFLALEALLKSGERVSGLFCEFPSNPLLMSPDLDRLKTLADEYGFLLGCDDTVAGFCNVDLLTAGGVDFTMSSLTKQFTGSGNVMGGTIVLNQHSSNYLRLRARMQRDYEELIFPEDAAVLLRSSLDLVGRSQRGNASTEAVVDLLRASPLVETVYYPKFIEQARYTRWMKHDGGGGEEGSSGERNSHPGSFNNEVTSSSTHKPGFGCLFSVVFRNKADGQRFYDALDVSKGPGFGTNFSLACPYTLLAHYTELDWAAAHGVDASLVRMWVGQEPVHDLLAVVTRALEACKGPLCAE